MKHIAMILIAGCSLLMVDATATVSEALTWKDHACWCRTHHRKGHGVGCAAFGLNNMILRRRQITQMAIVAAQAGQAAGALNLMMACQCQNRGAQRSFAQNEAELMTWLNRGGPC